MKPHFTHVERLRGTKMIKCDITGQLQTSGEFPTVPSKGDFIDDERGRRFIVNKIVYKIKEGSHATPVLIVTEILD